VCGRVCALGSRYVPRQVWMLRHDGLMLSESAEQGQHRPRGKVRGGPGGVPFRRRSRVRRPAFHTMLHLSIAAPQLARALPLASRAPGTVGGTMKELQGEVQEPLRPNLQVHPIAPRARVCSVAIAPLRCCGAALRQVFIGLGSRCVRPCSRSRHHFPLATSCRVRKQF